MAPTETRTRRRANLDRCSGHERRIAPRLPGALRCCAKDFLRTGPRERPHGCLPSKNPKRLFAPTRRARSTRWAAAPRLRLLIPTGVVPLAAGEARRKTIRVETVRKLRQRGVSAHYGSDGIWTLGKVVDRRVLEAILDWTAGAIGSAGRRFRPAIHRPAGRACRARAVARRRKGAVACHGHSGGIRRRLGVVRCASGVLCSQRNARRRSAALRSHGRDSDAKSAPYTKPHCVDPSGCVI